MHKLLHRQLKKYAGEDLLQNSQFIEFIDAVNDSYFSFEKDKELSEHAFKLSEEEFNAINSRLREEIDLRKLSLLKLKETLTGISTDHNADAVSEEDDLLVIVEMLNMVIQKRKEAEEELIQAKIVAENASMAKSEFLSVMSHEIRTPLNAVIGMGHLLLKSNPRPDQIENLTALKISADNLLVLVNDILDFNKIEAGKLELEKLPFELSKLVSDIVNANTLTAREKQNQISLQIGSNIPSQLLGDAIRLGQVLNNLISNAVKFTEKGKIEITVSRMESGSDHCRVMFAVNDTGIGIPMEKLSTIFQPFTQAGSSITRKYGGTGLGLSISQRILELMDSGLEVISEAGKGSQFYFSVEFPLISETGEAIEQITDQEPDLKNKKILLVEDTPFNVLFATQLLEGWNAQVDVADNGAIAVDMVKQNHYDLILMDLQMPVMDGYTASKKIREINQQLPIIALTASATSNVKGKVLEAGMQDYVTKPFNPTDFFLRLKKYL